MRLKLAHYRNRFSMFRTYYALREGLVKADGIEFAIVEVPDPNGPYGAKGVSEPATIPTTPAILNAIYDAVGVRVKETPAKPERVFQLLRAKEQQQAATS